MMAALGVLQVREQFYRLDKRGAGFLSMEHYKSMLSVKQGGALVEPVELLAHL